MELMADSLKDSVDKYNLRHRRRMQEVRERTELLGRVSADSSHVLRIFDDKAQAMQSARSSSRMLEETLATETVSSTKSIRCAQHCGDIKFCNKTY